MHGSHDRRSGWARRRLFSLLILLGALSLSAAGCSDDTGGAPGDGDGSDAGDAGDLLDADGGDDATDSDATDSDATDDGDATDGDATDGDGGDASDGDDATDGVTDPCDALACGPTEACEVDDSGQASCVERGCDVLECGPTEVCQVDDSGQASCVDNSCASDLDCPPDAFCDGAVCQPQVCAPGARVCAGDAIERCEDNGSAWTTLATCEGSVAFDSACVLDPGGQAACSCQGDWDCPEFMFCEAGLCGGSGQAPTCALAAVPFEDIPPDNELQWGGAGRGDRAARDFRSTTACADDAACDPGGACDQGACVYPIAFPGSAQVLSTPAVANLDDDNGDGLINELDFPEVIFLTYSNANPGNSGLRDRGVIRAIHSGGPRKGRDFFATCGTRADSYDASGARLASGGLIWQEGMDTADLGDCADDDFTPAVANSMAGVAVGDLDGDGAPEVVVLMGGAAPGLQILSNTGEILLEHASAQWPVGDDGWPDAGNASPAPVIANVDGAGLAEVVIGSRVFTFTTDPTTGALAFGDRFDGPAGLPVGFRLHGPLSCVADIAGDSRQEIIAGSAAYRMPLPPAGASTRADCASQGGAVTPAAPEEQDFCDGLLSVVWDAQTVNGADPAAGGVADAHRDGFCAVADLLGADELADPGPGNPPDGEPEVALINNGHLLILNGETGALRRYLDLESGSDGGAPNVDDFDGDGFPEVASALRDDYMMVDLQTPSAACPVWDNLLDDDATDPADFLNGNPPRTPGGACATSSDCADGAFCFIETGASDGLCTCLHNGWKQRTEDDSSRGTGSSVFDFNGDGAAEVVYNDECYFRIYSGVDGAVLFKEAALSRTGIENPIIADVDNDGNAEIVFATNNETVQCNNASPAIDANTMPNGIGVWGDPTDVWVSARRVWNQHTYHVTNVLEGGGVPVSEVPSWTTYNTYRSNPRSVGAAPDLAVVDVQLVVDGGAGGAAGCDGGGAEAEGLLINVVIENRGDLRVGPGLELHFSGDWGGVVEPLEAGAAGAGAPLIFTLQNSLEPGARNRISVTYVLADNGDNPDALPDRVTATIDPDLGSGFGAERECDESNNTLDADVSGGGGGGAGGVDLIVTLDAVTPGACPEATLAATVTNAGDDPAVGVIARFYAGDPEAGGVPFHAEGPFDVAAGASRSLTPSVATYPPGDVLVFVVVDPDDAVAECNDANNTDRAEARAACIVF